MTTPRPFIDWPEFDITQPATAPVGHSIADETVDISELTFDDMAATERNVDRARTVIHYLLQAVEDHCARDHMCATTCVDTRITAVLDGMDLASAKLTLLVLLKDLEHASDEDEPAQDDT